MLCRNALAEKEKDAKKEDNKKEAAPQEDPMTGWELFSFRVLWFGLAEVSVPSKSAESLNVVVILRPGVFENPQVQKDLKEASEAGSNVVILSDVTSTADMLAEIMKAPESVRPALSR
ncbi:hypothetical protein FOZ62_016437 [Perkinsus olseni]|uniref:Uncharacterized protein n=1 Tax=Perkinsus olseni TaxID=32597 RepID=A0A7J6TFV3_PEROL|nr:hypothetical protein FOZ62_016437 [Perkinsus olseni]